MGLELAFFRKLGNDEVVELKLKEWGIGFETMGSFIVEDILRKHEIYEKVFRAFQKRGARISIATWNFWIF